MKLTENKSRQYLAQVCYVIPSPLLLTSTAFASNATTKRLFHVALCTAKVRTVKVLDQQFGQW